MIVCTIFIKTLYKTTLIQKHFHSYLFDTLHPVLNVLKGFLVSNVIHKDDTLT